jgi:tRNA threonylcarbamoyladenosine biosynthesis protein TsaE
MNYDIPGFTLGERTRLMQSLITNSPAETEAAGAELASQLKSGDVVALYGGLGMGKTAFVRGLAAGLGLNAEVSSPTFALVHEYGGNPPLVHFDMYRVAGWDDLYSTGFFDYLDAGAILAVEWSENVEAALPEHTIRVKFEKLDDERRRLDLDGLLWDR